jgi:hypothetical protein
MRREDKKHIFIIEPWNHKNGIHFNILYTFNFNTKSRTCTYLNPEDVIPDWVKCGMPGSAAFRLILRVAHIQDNKWVCLANMASTLDNRGFYQCHLELPNRMKLQEAASSNRDISLKS